MEFLISVSSYDAGSWEHEVSEGSWEEMVCVWRTQSLGIQHKVTAVELCSLCWDSGGMRLSLGQGGCD